MFAEDGTLYLGCLSVLLTFLHTHRLLDDAGDHRVGKVQVFRPLRHFLDRSGRPGARPADSPHPAVPPPIRAVNSALSRRQTGDSPSRLQELANEKAPPEEKKGVTTSRGCHRWPNRWRTWSMGLDFPWMGSRAYQNMSCFGTFPAKRPSNGHAPFNSDLWRRVTSRSEFVNLQLVFTSDAWIE